MNNEKQKSKLGKKGIAIISAAAVFAVIFAFLLHIQIVLGSKNIYSGVSVGNIDVGGMSRSEAKKELKNYFGSHGELVLNFDCEGVEFAINSKDISFEINADSALSDAVNAGRKGGFFKRYRDIMSYKRNGYTIPIKITYDKDRLLVLVDEQIQDMTTDSTPMDVQIGTDRLYVTNSVAGKGINKDDLISKVDKHLKKLSSDGVIVLNITDINSNNLSADEFIEKYTRDAKDAVYSKTSDGYTIEPEIVGISLNKKEAKKILEENKNSTSVYEIPAKITMPQVTAKMLEDKYVNKIISTFSTSFAGSSANRCANIALAAAKINGYVINPGKRFSYNTVVGPRTAAAGFKSAHVYVGNEVVDGIGGGICQVSSTLYNSVVFADLKIVLRTNHSMPVGYVPLGRDATVSYGSIDFVFENNKKYPVSIKASVSGTTLTVSIVGTSDMDYTVEFATQTTGSVPYSTVRVDDPTLPEGTTKTIKAGSNGTLVNSYRVYKKNGKEYSRTFESRSTYSATPAKIAVGTKKAEQAPSPSPTPTPTPPESNTPEPEPTPAEPDSPPENSTDEPGSSPVDAGANSANENPLDVD